MESLQTRNSPVIVGEQYDLAETLAASYSGELHGALLGKQDYCAALLPMSGYEKLPHADLSRKLFPELQALFFYTFL